jgi:hypothetical protein
MFGEEFLPPAVIVKMKKSAGSFETSVPVSQNKQRNVNTVGCGKFIPQMYRQY